MDGLEVLEQIFDADVAPVGVAFDLMEDGSPDGHGARAVGRNYLVAEDDLAGSGEGELAVIVTAEEGEIGNPGVEGGDDGSVSAGFGAVAGGAVGAEEIGAGDGADEGCGLRGGGLRGRGGDGESLLAGGEQRDGEECKR